MSGLDQNDKERLFKVLKDQTEKLEKLERGMYGDKANGVKGLIARTDSIEAWITKSKLKIAAGLGAWTVLLFFGKAAWDWFIHKKP